jgi:hypothetical protein
VTEEKEGKEKHCEQGLKVEVKDRREDETHGRTNIYGQLTLTRH